MNERKLPIGIQSFKSLIQDNYLYVDKTRFIYKLARNGKQYFLSRPRRFGKSLLLSAMKEYWEGNRELFSGLDIERLEENDSQPWKQYPVFYFDFNGKNYTRCTALEEVLEYHLNQWENRYGLKNNGLPLEDRFKILLETACTYTGLGCVVLVDEYDKSLLETMENIELEEHNRAVFKGFFGSLKSHDQFIKFVFITGVTKFSKVSIFSDLNQLRDISINEQYSDICGITEKEMISIFGTEINAMCEKNGISYEECLDRLRKEYDGYLFHQNGERVYNPYSLLNAFADLEFGSYWFETGTPTFLVKRVREAEYDIKKAVEGEIYKNKSVLSDYEAHSPDPVPILFQTGYLTIKGADGNELKLGFPNEEVEYGFLSSLLPDVLEGTASFYGTDISSLRRSIAHGDTETVHDFFTALISGIPYSNEERLSEHYFQTVVYLVFTLLGTSVRTEVHSSKGRADCIAETKDYVYLFEFKRDRTAKEAVEQINEKGYFLPFKADKRTVYRIGVNIDSQNRQITDWIVEE